MIGFIKGKIIACEEGMIIIENNGIGYEINVSDSTEFAGNISNEVIVYTSMLVRDDDISLCGFKTKADLTMFKKLLAVNGVGAKAALAVLSVMKAEELSKAILFEDVTSITRAPGIGKKTAQRIVLELKDKVDDISGLSGGDTSFVTSNTNGGGYDAKAEALAALIALGYSRGEAGDALSRIQEECSDAQEYIKLALKRLM